MITINRLYYLDSERKLSAALESYKERSFSVVRSSKISNKREDCLDVCRQ